MEEVLPPEKQIAKLKLFISTVHQFAKANSQELGDSVKALVLDLLLEDLSIDNFYTKLQTTTKFPLRPFVIPFLKLSLPLLRHELEQLSRVELESSVFGSDPTAKVLNGCSNGDPKKTVANGQTNLTLSPVAKKTALNCSTNEKRPQPTTVSKPTSTTPSLESPRSTQDGKSLKRKIGAIEELKVGVDAKRFASDVAYLANLPRLSTKEPPAATIKYSRTKSTSEPSFLHNFSSCFKSFGSQPSTSTSTSIPSLLRPQQSAIEGLTAESWEGNLKEWAAVENLFGHLVTCMDQLRYALAMFQHRLRFSEVWNGYLRQEKDGKIEEVKRRADLAVQEIKRQALLELQKAVGAAEKKAVGMMSDERDRLEQALIEAQTLLYQQENKAENCWNCGRRANQTCSSCQTARYCGVFCQHRDWGRHRFTCRQPTTAEVVPSQQQLVNGTSATAQSTVSPTISVKSERLDDRSVEESRLNKERNATKSV